jgi:hypothetical protein
MPTINARLSENLILRRSREGLLEGTETFYVEGITSNADPKAMLAEALSATGIPEAGTTAVVTVAGLPRTLGVADVTATPDGSNAATVTVSWAERAAIDPAGFGPTVKRATTTVEQGETEFDYSNQILPPGSRSPITVTYNDGTGAKTRVTAPIPVFIPRSTRVIEREETNPPEQYEEYVGLTNSTTFAGKAAGTLLFVFHDAVNVGDGKWRHTFQFAYDKRGFTAIARYINPDTGLPPSLTAADFAAQNGVKTNIPLYGSFDFNTIFNFSL